MPSASAELQRVAGRMDFESRASSPFHKRRDGIDVPFDLRSDIFRIQVGCGDIPVGREFPGVVQVMKKTLDIGQSMLPVKFAGDVGFLPVLFRGLQSNLSCSRFDGRFQTVKAIERKVVPIGWRVPCETHATQVAPCEFQFLPRIPH
ncbi:MAG: hypothetical protein HY822_11175 [Acidobacteria bacterium]|nr:hypothetical protein [Acidobacteriota bacterium]